MPASFTEDSLVGTLLRSWTVKEFEQYERGQWWYICAISAGLALLIFGLFSENFIFALIVVLTAIILYLQANQPPQDIRIQCTDLGIIIGSKFYSYDELESFYLVYRPGQIEMLFMRTKNIVHPLLRIPLTGQNPVEIRSMLLEFLNEDIEAKTEPLSDVLSRRLKLM